MDRIWQKDSDEDYSITPWALVFNKKPKENATPPSKCNPAAKVNWFIQNHGRHRGCYAESQTCCIPGELIRVRHVRHSPQFLTMCHANISASLSIDQTLCSHVKQRHFLPALGYGVTIPLFSLMNNPWAGFGAALQSLHFGIKYIVGKCIYAHTYHAAFSWFSVYTVFKLESHM